MTNQLGVKRLNIKIHIRKNDIFFFGFTLIYYLLLFLTYFVFIDGDNYYKSYSEGTSLRLHADSDKYVEVTKETTSINLDELITFDSNYFGPVIILKMLFMNHFMVLILNILLWSSSVYVISKSIPNIHIKRFNFWMYANVMLFFSLLTINKEIFSISAFLFLMSFLFRKKKRYLLLSLLLSFVARWQFFLLVVLYILLRYSHINRKVVILVSILISSILLGNYPEFTDILYIAGFMGKDVDTNEGFAFILNELQKKYYYWLILPFRVLSQMVFPFLTLIKNLLIKNIPWRSDFYNIIVVPLSCFTSGIFIVKYFLNKKFNIRSDIFFFSILVLISIGFTPFASYRYFFPVYMLLVLDYCVPKSSWTS